MAAGRRRRGGRPRRHRAGRLGRGLARLRQVRPHQGHRDGHPPATHPALRQRAQRRLAGGDRLVEGRALRGRGRRHLLDVLVGPAAEQPDAVRRPLAVPRVHGRARPHRAHPHPAPARAHRRPALRPVPAASRPALRGIDRHVRRLARPRRGRLGLGDARDDDLAVPGRGRRARPRPPGRDAPARVLARPGPRRPRAARPPRPPRADRVVAAQAQRGRRRLPRRPLRRRGPRRPRRPVRPPHPARALPAHRLLRSPRRGLGQPPPRPSAWPSVAIPATGSCTTRSPWPGAPWPPTRTSRCARPGG